MKTIYLYVTGLVAALITAAYVLGGRVATERWRNHAAESTVTDMEKIIKMGERVNAETIHHGTADIRRILRTKYTIAD